MERYNRQIILEEIGLLGQEKLANAKVLVVGAGGLGCPVLQYLVAAGVGTVGIADGDVVSVSNLHRQILYNSDDLGKLKVDRAKARLEKQNPEVEILALPSNILHSNAAEIIAQFDVVLDGTDQIPVRYLLNDVCEKLGKPWVYGAFHKFEGQVSVFNFKSGPSYRDLFPEEPAAGSIPSCAENGVLGVLPGMIGIAQATEVLKIIVGFGEVLRGKLWLFNAKTMKSEIIEFGVSQSAQSFAKKRKEKSYE